MANIQPLVDALNALVAGKQVAGFSKHIKAPEAFKPETLGDEVQKWQDWKFAFENFVGVVDPTMAQEMKDAAQKADEIVFSNLTAERKRRAEKLYSLLSSLMKNRPLRLVRGISHQNGYDGYEAWRVIMKDMQPPTRQRALALVQALNKVKFEANKSISEQQSEFELMVREYERTSNSTYPDDLKVAAVLAALPASLKMNLQTIITDLTTYDEVKARIELYEQVTTQWSSDSLSMPAKAAEDESAPMEVDAIWQKGKKGKGEGFKGKFSKGKEKGKSKGWKGRQTPTAACPVFPLKQGGMRRPKNDNETSIQLGEGLRYKKDTLSCFVLINSMLGIDHPWITQVDLFAVEWVLRKQSLAGSRRKSGQITFSPQVSSFKEGDR